MGVLGRGWLGFRVLAIVLTGAVIYLVSLFVHVDPVPPWIASRPHVARVLSWVGEAWPWLIGILVGYRASVCRGAGPWVGFAIGLIVALPIVMLVDVRPTAVGAILTGKSVVLLWFLAPPAIGGMLAGWVKGMRRRGRVRAA